MAWKIRITKLALEDIAESASYYADASDEVARKWLIGLDLKILELETMPRQFPFAPENEDLEFEARQFHYHSHRVIFTLEGEAVVQVLRVYHSSRRPLVSEDFAAD